MIKTTVKEKEGCVRILSVEVPREQVSRVLDETLIAMSKYASVPGFRLGKAPKDLVMAHYGERIKDEALKRLISDSYQEVLDTAQLVPVSVPEVYELEFFDEKPLRFNIKLEVKPDIKLKEFFQIKIKRKKYTIKESDVEERLNYLRESNAEFVSVEDRSIQNSDYVIADVECFVDGISKEKTQNIWLAIKEDSQDEIAKALLGSKRDEIKRIIQKLPDNYPKEDLRSKEAEFVITIKEIKKKILPELDDEFAKLVGNFNSLDELRTGLKQSLKVEYMKLELEDVKAQAIDALNNLYDFCVPASFVTREAERIKDQLRHKLLESNVKEELLNEKIAKIEPSIKEDATKNVKVYLILNEIADTHSIGVNEEELAKRVEVLATVAKQDAAGFRDYLIKNGLLDDIKLQIRQDKVLDFILSKAEVIEEEVVVLTDSNAEKSLLIDRHEI
ncbi:MAG: trigger factor [Candidatus Omnitrophica bacterium]|nr:trigger factor [Candidatus Omnitrophota bacterium]